MKTKRKLLLAALAILLACCILYIGMICGAYRYSPRARASRYLERTEMLAPLPRSAHEVLYEARGPGTEPGALRFMPSFGDVDIIISFRADPRDVEAFVRSCACLTDAEPEVDAAGNKVYDVKWAGVEGCGWNVTVSLENTAVRILFWSEFT